MSVGREIPDLPPEVIEASKENRLVLFLGAGLSCAAGLSDWYTLKNQLVDGFTPRPGDAPNIKEALKAESDYYVCFSEVYKRDKVNFLRTMEQSLKTTDETINNFSELMGYLKKLNPVSFVTLNVDSLIVERNPINYHAIRLQGNCWPWDIRDGKVFCFHGLIHFDGDNKNGWVFTEEDLDKRYNLPDSERFLRGLFSGHYVVLFVGFSFSDKRLLKYVELPDTTLEEIESKKRSNFHYALISSEASTIKAKLNRYGVTPLEFHVPATEADPKIKFANFKRTLSSWAHSMSEAEREITADSGSIPEGGPEQNV